MLGNWNSKLYEPRKGLMLHYDDSSDDKNAVIWLTKDKTCQVSYNRLYLDDGTMVQIAPDDKRAWHAGVCAPSDPRLQYHDANSAFHGWAIAANGKEQIKKPQFDALLRDAIALFRQNKWEPWRLTTHAREAWPRGRKIDIEGPNKKQPVLDVDIFKKFLAAGLSN